MKKTTLFVALVLACCLAYAQSGTAASVTGAATGTTDPQPAPYGEDEFPEWVEDLRRFEIIAIGSFPISYFFTSFGFGSYRFFDSYDPLSGFDQYYAPWPFSNEFSYKPTSDEIVQQILVSGGISLFIGLIDYILVKTGGE